MEISEYLSNNPSVNIPKEKPSANTEKKSYSPEFLEFLQQMFNLTEKFKTLKSLLIANKLKNSENYRSNNNNNNNNNNFNSNSENENEEFNYGITKIKQSNEIFSFNSLFKNFNFNISEKIPFYNSITNITENQYFGYFITFFNSITIYGRSPIKAHNFYHYTTEAWLLTVFCQIKNAMKAEGNSPNNKPIRAFKDLFYFIKNLKLNEQLFLKNLEIILGTYDLSDHIVKVSEFKLSQQFLKRLRFVLDSDNELKSSFGNLKLYLQVKQEENNNSCCCCCCLDGLLSFSLLNRKEEDKEKEKEKEKKLYCLNANKKSNGEEENLNLNSNNKSNNKNNNNNNANVQENLLNNFIEKSEDDYFTDKNFELSKSGFLFLLKDILDKVLNYTLNELDTKEKNKDSSKLYQTYRSMIFSCYTSQNRNQENLFGFNINENPEAQELSLFPTAAEQETENKEKSKHKTAAATTFTNSNYIPLTNTKTKSASKAAQAKNEMIKFNCNFDSENKIAYESFCKELKKHEKINNLSDFSHFQNQTYIHTINNMSSIANELSEGAMEENSINSFASDAELLNANQTFYDYGITCMQDFFEDIELITLKSASFCEKISAMLKNNCNNIKKNMLYLVKNNLVFKEIKFLMRYSCDGFRKIKGFLLHDVLPCAGSLTVLNCKSSLVQMKAWISDAVQSEYALVKNLSKNFYEILFENFAYCKANFFVLLKQPRLEIKKNFSSVKNFVDNKVLVHVKSAVDKGKEILFIYVDYEKLLKIFESQKIKFFTNPINSLVSYFLEIYNNVVYGNLVSFEKFDLVIKIINIPTRIAKTQYEIFYNLINFVYEQLKNCLVFNCSNFYRDSKEEEEENKKLNCSMSFNYEKENKDYYECEFNSINNGFKKLLFAFLEKFGFVELSEIINKYFVDAFEYKKNFSFLLDAFTNNDNNNNNKKN